MLDTPHLRRPAALLATLLFASSLGAPGVAAAQPKRDPAAADEAFRAAVEAKLRGDLATACAKFEASMQLDPSPSTLLNVAECQENDGHFARAWSTTQRALVLNQETPGDQRRRELETYATKTADRLRQKLAWIRITLKSPPEGLAVERDGLAMPAALLDQPIPADPGRSKISASAPGHAPFEVELALSQGETKDVVIALSPAPQGPKAKGRTTGPEAPASRPIWPFVAGGAGLALVGVAIGFGVSEAGTQSEIDAKCHASANGRCPADFPYAQKNDQLYRDFGLSLGFGIAGALAIGAGAVGLVLGPSKPVISPYAGPKGGGLAVGGTF